MVSIKSLAVLLFAAAVTAVPLAGEKPHGNPHGNPHSSNNVNVKDAHEVCGEQNQEFYCCNTASASKNTDAYTGVLNGLDVKCNNVVGKVWAVDVLSGSSACKAQAACCSDATKQNGPVNLGLSCIAFPGLN